MNCSACSDLNEFAPEFMREGVTDTVCTSLQNDTGLNPELNVLHDDYTDLEAINDCVIGTKDAEVDAYNNCDWKEYVHSFIPGLYQYFKAINCTIKGVWGRVTCVYNGIKKLIEALDGSVGGESFVRYYRDNSSTGAGYEWPAVLGENHTLDIYMDADVDNPGTKEADRDYIVIVSNCTNFHHFLKMSIQQTLYSSGDTRPLATIRLRQAQHPSLEASTVTDDFSWPVTASVVIHKGEHIKLDGYVDRLEGGESPDYRFHQIICTWIPIAPVGGWDLSQILDC